MSPGEAALGRTLGAVRTAAAVAAALGVVAITLLGVADVVGRSLWSRPLLGQVEVARILLVYVAFLGLAEAEHAGGHVRLRVLDSVLRRGQVAARDVVVHSLALGVAGLLTCAAAVYAWSSWQAGETLIAPIQLPAWPAKLGVTVGFLLFTLELALGLRRRITGWIRS